MMKRFTSTVIYAVLVFSFCPLSIPLYAADAPADMPAKEPPEAQAKLLKPEEPVGELFGVPVPAGNYAFVQSAILVFGYKWGAQPKDAKELDECVWNDLLLSFESFRRGIEIPAADVETEVGKTLAAEKVTFDWKTDKEAYTKYLKEKVNEPPELFENQLKHLLQLQKLRTTVMDEMDPPVTDEEAFQKFLDEYNTLSVELVQFDELKDAEEFYKRVKADPKAWESEKEKRPKEFRRPGFVSFEFLTDMWKIPKDACYEMVKMKAGEYYPPRPVYKGHGVFQIIETRIADEKLYPKQKEHYFKAVKMRKRYEGLQEWNKKLKEDAKIKVYPRAIEQNMTEKKEDGVNNKDNKK